MAMWTARSSCWCSAIRTRCNGCPHSIAAALLLVVALAAQGFRLFAARADTAAPAAEMRLLIGDGRPSAAGRSYAIDLDRTTWTPGSPLVVDTLRTVPTPAFALGEVGIANPLGDGWAFARETHGDSGVIDIYTADAAGRVRRRTRFAGDDLAPTWSPDGRYLAFMSTHWVSLSRYDIAVLDVRTDSVRRLTSGDASDFGPLWSPDGTRLAFKRRWFDVVRDDELCWIALDGSELRCGPLPHFRLVSPLAWHGAGEIVALVDSAGRRALGRVTLASGQVRVVEWTEGHCTVSPGGAWVACFGERDEVEGRQWYAYPIETPDRARTLQVPGASSAPKYLHWLPPARAVAYLDSLRLTAPRHALPADVPYHVRVDGIDSRGEPMPVPVRRWSSGDTAVATVDAAGVVRPRRPGSVAISLSAGGWRARSVTLTFGASSHAVAVATDWSRGLPDEWRIFGAPPPRAVRHADGTPALWLAGDGSFSNGAYMVRELDAARGVGVEAVLSTPLTAVQWQTIGVTLGAHLDSERLAAWNHRDGAIPSRGEDDSCGFGFPDGEGRAGMDRMSLQAGGEPRPMPAPPWMRTGRWYRVRVQILPDGRCGIAIDGTPVWLSRQRLAARGRVRAQLIGNSEGTRILVGPVEVWTGVRGDVDWQAADARTTVARR